MIVDVTLVVNERKRDHDELHMREMLERNSSMEVQSARVCAYVCLLSCYVSGVGLSFV